MKEIIDWVVGLAALVAVLEYFGIKPKAKAEGESRMSSGNFPSKKWKLVLMLFLVASSLGMSSYSLFFRHPEPRFRLLSEDQLIHVQNKTFRNETVELDGHHYDGCTFINVKFAYQGTANVEFTHNHLNGYGVSTNDPAVSGTIELLRGLGMIKSDIPLFDKDWNPSQNQPPISSPNVQQH
jgi:hypothetical protein